MESDSWSFSPGGTPKQARPANGPDPVVPAPAVPPPPAPSPVGSERPHLQQVVYAQPALVSRPTNGLATASLVLGILGLFIPILGVLAVIFGSIGISKANQGASGKGLAIAGLVLGILGTLALLYLAGGGGS